MNDSANAIKGFVLRAISDDYEAFERVLQDVTGWVAESGLAVDSRTVLIALEDLISEGYAQAYMLSERPQAKAEPVVFSESRLSELWFYTTPTGKELARSFGLKWRRNEEQH